MLKPKLSLKARALRYLSMREHSRLELARKLSPYVGEESELETLLTWLEESKFLCNQRFTDSLVHKRQARFGNQKILAELQGHQLDKDDLVLVKDELQLTESQRAIDVLWRKFPSAPLNHQEKMKQMQFLAQRGFTSRAIDHAIRASREDHEFP